MVSRLEIWAEDARANGHANEGAVIADLAKVFSIAGVPEEFSQATVEGQLIQAGNRVLKEEIEIMDRLLGVLSSATIEPGSSPLTRELAREINQQVGQYLSDETPTQNLILPSRRVERKVERLNMQLLITYNRALKAIDRAHYSTIGSIRDIPSYVLKKGRNNIGDVTIVFVKTAFARPQAGK